MRLFDFALRVAPNVLHSDCSSLVITAVCDGSGSVVDYPTLQCISRKPDPVDMFRKVVRGLVHSHYPIQRSNETAFISILDDRADDLFGSLHENPNVMQLLIVTAVTIEKPCWSLRCRWTAVTTRQSIPCTAGWRRRSSSTTLDAAPLTGPHAAAGC